MLKSTLVLLIKKINLITALLIKIDCPINANLYKINAYKVLAV